MYAVIQTGGKQYRVTKGDVIYVEKLDQEPESTVIIRCSYDWRRQNFSKSASPFVKDATVEGKVLGQVKGEKIIIYKYKAKKNYHRKAGHRQNYSEGGDHLVSTNDTRIVIRYARENASLTLEGTGARREMLPRRRKHRMRRRFQPDAHRRSTRWKA